MKHLTLGFVQKSRLHIAILVTAILLVFTSNAFTSQSSIIQTRVKTGYVMAKTVVTDENDEAILVEYNDDGTEAATINLPVPSSQVNIISASFYLGQQLKLQTFLSAHANDLSRSATLLSATQYQAATFVAADNLTEIDKPQLDSSVKSVLVRGQADRLGDATQLILLHFNVDLSQSYSVPAGMKSLIINQQGQVLSAHEGTVGPRSSFYSDNGNIFEPGDHGAVSGVKVYVRSREHEAAITNEQGVFALTTILPACLPFPLSYRTELAAQVNYLAFNPKGLAPLSYWTFVNTYDVCMSTPNLGAGTHQGEIQRAIDNILNSNQNPITKVPFLIDIMSLSGQLTFEDGEGNKVEIGSHTRYNTPNDENPAVAQQFYDFDQDGVPDLTKLGRLETITENQQQVQRFTTELNGEEASIQGVWFSSNLTQNREPDLIRQADRQAQLHNTGLLSSISKSDLANTDILVFRESTGEAIVNRQGLKGKESDNIPPYYRITLRGPNASLLSAGADIFEGQKFSDWTSTAGYTENYQNRASNHLKPGEWVNIVAINRSTGYLGTIRTQLTNITNSTLLEPIILRPPNIKVWAERNYDTSHGLTSGQNHSHLIGSDGASLLSDNELVVYTEWLNADGSPLPNGLANNNGQDYGFTGRLAKIVAPNLLDNASGSQLSHFPIRPNRQTQVLKFANDDTTPNHFYIHVSAEPIIDGPDFADNNNDYEGRPSTFVPLLTPVEDEENNLQQWLVYNEQINQYQQPNQPLPSYQWLYRPEYQFSRYQFALTLASNDNNLLIDNSILDPQPATGNELLEAFYSLVAGNYDRLSTNTNQTFVLAFGENELQLIISPDGKITFPQSSLDYLSQLEPDNYLSLRLYLNEDSQNILWDYAFLPFGLVTDMNNDGHIITTPDSDHPIDTNNRIDNPLLMWVNDNFDSQRGEDDRLPLDNSDSVVNGMHDLIDFFPIYLDVASALERFPASEHNYSLQQAQSAFNFFGDITSNTIEPTNVELELKPNVFLTHPPTAEQYAEAELKTINELGVIINEEFISRIGQGLGGVIYLEATTASNYHTPFELVLNITQKSDNKNVATSSIWINAAKVQNMFRHANLRNVPNPVMNGDQLGLPDTGIAAPPGYPDSRSQNEYFVFLHGYNVDPDEAGDWHSDIFKRTYRFGFKGKFMGVTWVGDTGEDYHKAVYNAFNTSQYLPAAIQQKTPNASSTYIAAHSLGNVVVSNAISHQGLAVDKYFLFNAAVPIEAYDASQTQGACVDQEIMKNCMREKDMHDYPEKLFASEWHKLFPDTDPRKSLTWNNIFSPALKLAYNFYTPGDEVLENANDNESLGTYISDSASGLPWSWDFARHAWVSQEMSKGSTNLLAYVFSRRQAGWAKNSSSNDLPYIGIKPGRNPYRSMNAQEATAAINPDAPGTRKLTDQHLAQFGFFRPFEFNNIYAPIGDSEHMRSGGPAQQDMLELFSPENKNHTLWSLLAHAIPARSFAVATSSLKELERPGRNFNMQALRPDAPDGNPFWPNERTDDEDHPFDWFHSDIKNLPLPFVHHTFEKLLELAKTEETTNENN
ncbi:hypothetical protein [Agarivorans sp. 1_MG-2023]|uniref:hypothetical protein n=1 Tax=Agarivorans sp. 1_MG-2023 TaxID=3062634 RepID=UPI0026E3A378|nr:hypothetical protein [Agarivorans sp. 1_MG-2023]MDO6762038.1 hypothetical protein [Agarivorans sp. 1_MG-2023]